MSLQIDPLLSYVLTADRDVIIIIIIIIINNSSSSSVLNSALNPGAAVVI